MYSSVELQLDLVLVINDPIYVITLLVKWFKRAMESLCYDIMLQYMPLLDLTIAISKVVLLGVIKAAKNI